MSASKFEIQGYGASFGKLSVLRDVKMRLLDKRVTSIIGPSGCGKSTLLRGLNRMHELVPGARTQGRILLDGQDILGPKVDPTEVRRRVGMVFQKPNPFPSMSIAENVAAGLTLTGRRLDAAGVEAALRAAALWDEVKDRLSEPGGSLSGGQQQRLCIARALAVQPEVLLMDEPCSALDPIATLHIEELIRKLVSEYTIVIVTHSMAQARRVSHETAFFLAGELVEQGATEAVFTAPRDTRTGDYVQGRFG